MKFRKSLSWTLKIPVTAFWCAALLLRQSRSKELIQAKSMQSFLSPNQWLMAAQTFRPEAL
jgi:hypothetical protein